jgi:hypothetical protein
VDWLLFVAINVLKSISALHVSVHFLNNLRFKQWFFQTWRLGTYSALHRACCETGSIDSAAHTLPAFTDISEAF